MHEHQYAKICTLALSSAGLLYTYKAMAIVFTDKQPPLVFELAQVLMPIGVVGLYLAIEGSRWLEKIGLMLAALGFFGSISAILYTLIPGARISSSDEFFFPFSLFVLAGSVGSFLALAVLSVAFYRARHDLGFWRCFPLIMALLPLPLAVTGIIHIELPMFLIGMVWMTLAYFLARLANWNGKNAGSPAAG